MAEPRAHQILVRRDAEHVGKQPQEMERTDAGLRRGILEIDFLVRIAHRSRVRFPRRDGGRDAAIEAGFAPACRKPPRQSGWPAHWPISPRPMSLLPSAAACASSPSTISSGSGGAEPICQTAGLSPIASTSSARQEERQALVAADMIMGAGIFIAGMADQHRSRDQFLRTCRGSAGQNCSLRT